jgi:hypothetical protein
MKSLPLQFLIETKLQCYKLNHTSHHVHTYTTNETWQNKTTNKSNTRIKLFLDIPHTHIETLNAFLHTLTIYTRIIPKTRKLHRSITRIFITNHVEGSPSVSFLFVCFDSTLNSPQVEIWIFLFIFFY